MVPESKPAKNGNTGSSTTKKAKKKLDSDSIDDEAGSECKFPVARVRRLARSADPTTRNTPESIFLINKASEMFLEKLTEDAFNNMFKERKKLLHYNHVCECLPHPAPASSVQNKKRYEFLSDFVPEKVRAEVALQERALSDSRP